MIRFGRQNGYILLPVILAIMLVATIAFMLNQQSALDTNMSVGQYQAESVEQIAQAGLQHALWTTSNNSCAGDMSMPSSSFGPGTYSATIESTATTTTQYTLNPDSDTYVRENSPDTNFGTVNGFFTGPQRRALVHFDLTSITAGSPVVSATLWLYVTTNDPDASINLHTMNAGWTETGATWNNSAANYDTQVFGVISPQPAANVWVAANVTALAQSWVNDDATNYGVMLIVESLVNDSKFNSRENGVATQPYLQVTTADAAVSPVNISVSGTLTGNPSPANDISRSLTRTNLPAYQLGSNTTLQPGAASGEDAEIFDQAPNNNYGGAVGIWVSSASNDTTRSLLRFNLGTIPSAARILQASLSLLRQSGSGADQPVSVHRIKNLWSEDSVSWNNREAGTNWDTAGGDYDNIAVATTPVGPANQRYDWNITPLVQGWVDGRYPNYGVALVAAIADMPGERFYTSDDADPTRHPKLTITYSCECGSACLAPQGSGTVGMVVFNPTTLVPADTYKKALFESWGYTVNLIGENTSAAGYMTAAASNDVFFISESVGVSQVGIRIKDVPIGVVSQDGTYNSQLGLAAGNAWTVASGINVTDTSHYITAVFPPGPLDIYSGGMEQLTIAGSAAPGLQQLANTGGAGSLVVLDKSAALDGGGTAAGFRVMLPLGRDTKLNWDYLNANGRLIVQRALQWGVGAGEVALAVPIAHWKLDETSGTIAVDSVGGHDGTVSGASWAAGQVDGGLDFDHINDKITVPHNDALSLTETFAFSAWINATAYSGYQTILSKVGVSDLNYWFGTLDDELILDFYVAGVWYRFVTDNTNLLVGNWYHVAASFDNATDSVRLYVNGVEAFNGVMTATLVVNTADILIGNSRFLGEEWRGLLDEVRIYDQVLNASEIADLAVADGGGSGGGGASPTILLSTTAGATLGGLGFVDDDIAEYDPVADSATLYLTGLFADTLEDIDALHVLPNGHIILSPETDAQIGETVVGDEDLAEYDPAIGTTTIYFRGNDHFSTSDEDINAIYVMDNGHLLLSTTGNANLGGLNFGDDDLVEYDPATDTATLYLDGGTLFNASTEDFDAVYLLSNGHILFSTQTDAAIGGLAIGEDDLVEYDPATGTATIYFDGNTLFNSTNEDVDAVYVVE